MNDQQPDPGFFRFEAPSEKGEGYKSQNHQQIVYVMEGQLPGGRGNANVALVNKGKGHHIFKHIDPKKHSQENHPLLFDFFLQQTQLHGPFSPGQKICPLVLGGRPLQPHALPPRFHIVKHKKGANATNIGKVGNFLQGTREKGARNTPASPPPAQIHICEPLKNRDFWGNGADVNCKTKGGAATM